MDLPPVRMLFIYIDAHAHACITVNICTYVQHNSHLFCFRYHTGSLAFGALIRATVQLIRVILEYLDHRPKGEIYESSLAYQDLLWEIPSFLPSSPKMFFPQ